MEDESKTDPPQEDLSPDLPQEESPRRSEYTVSRGVQTVISIAILMATLLTLWNPRRVLKTPDLEALLRQHALQQQQKTPETTDEGSRIGLLVGHWQDNQGEVCADGLVESDVNLNIVNRAAQALIAMGYKVDIFPEFDLGLLNYRAAALVAVYSGSCALSPPPPSGFKIGTSLTMQNPEEVNRLAVCLAEAYQERTRLAFSYEVINPDHFSYHVFRDVHPDTPAVRMEIGSLSTDRDTIVSQADNAANGIAAGILCFVESSPEN